MTETSTKLNTARHLSPEDAKQHRTALMGWFCRFQDILLQNPGSCLVSRKDSDQLWRQTGFLIEDNIVHAKLGEHHYQAIGKLDGDGFHPTEGSKLIFAHDFAVAVLTPFTGPFQVVQVEKAGPVDSKDSAALTDKERKMFEENLKDLAKFYDIYRAASDEGDAQKIIEAESDVLDCLRLACIQCPKLDQKLTEFSIKNPDLELKPDLTGKIKPLQLFEIATEWMRLKLNDDGARRYFEGTTLVPSTETTEAQLAEMAVKKIEFLLSTVDHTPDMNLFKYLLEQTMAVFPALDEELKDFRTTADLIGAARQALPFMQKILADLQPIERAMPMPEVAQPTDTPPVT